MGNVKFVSKKFKNFRSFLTKTGRKKIGQKISEHAAQMNCASLISAKTSAFLSFLYRQDSKYTVCPLKNMKIEIFVANNSPKKILGG